MTELARLAEIEARPCPFCGATGAKLTPTPLPHDFGWQIQCNGCGARGPQSETGVGALLEWNEVAAELARLRSSPPEEQTQQVTREGREAMIEEVAAYLFDKYDDSVHVSYADLPEGPMKTEWWLHAVALVQMMEGRLRAPSPSLPKEEDAK